MSFNFYLGHSPSNTSVYSKDLTNSHIFITGRSGTGKSHLIKKLVAQAVEQKAIVLALDYTGDFKNYSPAANCSVERFIVDTPALTFNPLVAIGSQDEDLRAQQLLNLIHSTFRMGPRANIQLRMTTQEYLRNCEGIPTLDGLVQYMSAIKKPSMGILQAMEPLSLLASLMQCGTTPISLDFSSPGLKILSFDRVVDMRIRKIMIELIICTIFDQRMVNQSSDNLPIVFVLDEAHSLPWSENSMAVRLLREGRKFNLAGWFVSQYISNKTADAALSQAALRIHFRPDDKNLPKLVKLLLPADRNEADTYNQLAQNLGLGQFLMQTSSGQLAQVNVDP